MTHSYDKETMLSIHTNLMKHFTKLFNIIFEYDSMQILKQFCEDYLNFNVVINNILDNNRFINSKT